MHTNNLHKEFIFKTLVVIAWRCFFKNFQTELGGWAPVIPATWKAEAENCLNLGNSEPRLCHYIPAWVTE